MKLSRIFVLGLGFAVASLAQAQVNIDLVPQTAGPYPQSTAGTTDSRVRIDVMLSQTTTEDRYIRFIQLDANASDPALLAPRVCLGGADDGTPCTANGQCTSSFCRAQIIDSPFTHDGGTPGVPADDIRLWSFASTPACMSDPAMCGSGYLIDETFTDAFPPGTNSASITFGSATETSLNTMKQLMLPADGSAVPVATIEVVVPQDIPNGMYDLIVAATTADPDAGGQVHWGFGANLDNMVSITRIKGTGITGGSVTLEIGDPPLCADLVSSVPACDESLWRSANNTMRLTFSGPIVAPLAGEIEIVQLMTGGAVGGNISGSFTYTVEGGNVLRIRETGSAPLLHNSWYAVRNTGAWASACTFDVDYRVSIGDATNEGRVLSSDLVFINGGIPNFGAPDDSRQDINGDGRVLSSDLVAANGFIPTFGAPKPSGHVCTP